MFTPCINWNCTTDILFFIKWSKQEIKNTNTNTKQGKCCMENRPATATDLSS